MRQSLAKIVGIGKTTDHRILIQGELKPHEIEYWCEKSPDPEFEEKQVVISGLYLNPPENTLVLCVNKKSQIQALHRTQPMLPLRSGNPRRLTATYRKHGTNGTWCQAPTKLQGTSLNVKVQRWGKGSTRIKTSIHHSGTWTVIIRNRHVLFDSRVWSY